jgi:hypothetical protein
VHAMQAMQACKRQLPREFRAACTRCKRCKRASGSCHENFGPRARDASDASVQAFATKISGRVARARDASDASVQAFATKCYQIF